eukprot:SAG31_NODE_36293_length_314_cov_1.423256_1_plen_58_part_01
MVQLLEYLYRSGDPHLAVRTRYTVYLVWQLDPEVDRACNNANGSRAAASVGSTRATEL